MSDGLPRHFPLGEGKSFQLGRITLTFKTSATDTGSAYTLCEAVEPPDAGAGLHRHVSYDETHIICEGRYEAQLGDKTMRLSAGDMFFAPRGTPHSIKCVGPETGRELMISSPAGVFDALRNKGFIEGYLNDDDVPFLQAFRRIGFSATFERTGAGSRHR